MMKLQLVSLSAVLILDACAGMPTSKLATFTHADLQNAASIATKGGFPARAGVYSAIDTQLTACENALATLIPPTISGTVGIFSAGEVAAEAVSSGIPATVKANCEAIPIPSTLLLPLK